jgi:hypothetical protein
MSTVLGTYRNGTVTLHNVPAWPEASEVEISLVGNRIGCTEEEQLKMTSAQFNQWLDDLEPIIITPEEEARIEEALKAMGDASPAVDPAIVELFK